MNFSQRLLCPARGPESATELRCHGDAAMLSMGTSEEDRADPLPAHGIHGLVLQMVDLQGTVDIEPVDDPAVLAADSPQVPLPPRIG